MKSPLKHVSKNGRRGKRPSEPDKSPWVYERLNEAIDNAGGQEWYDRLVRDAKSVRDRVAILYAIAKCMPRKDRLAIEGHVDVRALALTLAGNAGQSGAAFIESVLQKTLKNGTGPRGYPSARSVLECLEQRPAMPETDTRYSAENGDSA